LVTLLRDPRQHFWAIRKGEGKKAFYNWNLELKFEEKFGRFEEE